MTEKSAIQRVIIDRVRPEIDSGWFPIKLTVGEKAKMRADIITDGHDAISGLLQVRLEGAARWQAAHMLGFSNDKWKASFKVTELGRYVYARCAWLDWFKSLRRDLVKRLDAGQDAAVDLRTGAALIKETLALVSEVLHLKAMRVTVDPHQFPAEMAERVYMAPRSPVNMRWVLVG